MHPFELHRHRLEPLQSLDDAVQDLRGCAACEAIRGSRAIAADELPGILAEQAAHFPRVLIERDTTPCRQELGGDDPQSGTQVVMEVEGAGRTERDLLFQPRKRLRSPA